MSQKYFTMKELPKSERPYEKFEELGVSRLSDAELVAVLIKSGTRNKNSIELAREILNLHPVHGITLFIGPGVKTCQRYRESEGSPAFVCCGNFQTDVNAAHAGEGIVSFAWDGGTIFHGRDADEGNRNYNCSLFKQPMSSDTV